MDWNLGPSEQAHRLLALSRYLSQDLLRHGGSPFSQRSRKLKDTISDDHLLWVCHRFGVQPLSTVQQAGLQLVLRA